MEGPIAPAGGRPADSLALLADQVDDAVWIVDRDGRVRHANAAALALTPSDPLGSHIASLPLDYRVALVATDARREGRCVRTVTDDAGGRALLMRGIRLDAEGTVALVLRDETRLRRLETVRRDFVSNVSHELRTPIAAIRLLVETLQAGALEDAEVAGDFVARIGRETGHMAQMVEELLQLGALEDGRRPLQVAPVPVEALMGAVDRLAPLAAERLQTLEVVVEEGTPPIAGDRAALEQVLRNLVHNAIKFTPRQGRIVLRGRRGDAGCVVIEVSDTGPGISAEDAARIFERFWKADRSRHRLDEGTGLGLAIVRHIVEAHGGSVGVESAPGEGATFRVVLPAAPG